MRIPRAALVGIGTLSLSLACAHAPASASSPVALAPRRVGPATSPAPPAHVLVTGSRLPQRVDPRSCLPATSFPVVIYSRQALMSTDRPGDLASALAHADPAAPCGP